jgi:hypothetical protein
MHLLWLNCYDTMFSMSAYAVVKSLACIVKLASNGIIKQVLVVLDTVIG